ncbi:MAG: SPFH domain-containing protein [Caldilineaceae bacterium]
MSSQVFRRPNIPMTTIVITLIVVAVVLFLFNYVGQFYYFFERVEAQEIGVQFQSGQIEEVVGPGVYSDFGLFVNLQKISAQAVPVLVEDPELLTKDKQRIGLVVTADFFRPGLAEKDTLRNLWARYRTVFTEDNALDKAMQNQMQQSMKVCVGDRNFDDAVIGTARDELQGCINDEIADRASSYGLTVANVAVPNVILLPEAQARLDEIVQSRLQTEKAKQDELRAKAEAAAEQARQEGAIRVEQSRLQEQTRQQITLAELERQKVEAQKVVIEAERANELARVEADRAIIEAQKSNDLLSAEKELEIQKVAALAAAEKAKADVANQLALGELYSQHPEFLQLSVAQANAAALKEGDKIIFTPEGTTPTLVLPGPGIVPTVDTTGSVKSEQ